MRQVLTSWQSIYSGDPGFRALLVRFLRRPLLELGLDIKELNIVNLRNVPPTRWFFGSSASASAPEVRSNKSGTEQASFVTKVMREEGKKLAATLEEAKAATWNARHHGGSGRPPGLIAPSLYHVKTSL